MSEGSFLHVGTFRSHKVLFFLFLVLSSASSAFNLWFSTQEAFHVIVFDVFMMTLTGRQRHYCPVDLNMTTIQR